MLHLSSSKSTIIRLSDSSLLPSKSDHVIFSTKFSKGLSLLSAMDSPSIIPRMQKDVRRAWQIKSLADLALIAGSPLDAAKFALLASAELNVLHNVRRYSAAISTWCAAVLTCLKEVDNNDSLRFLLKNIPNLAGFHKMRSVDYTACLRETLRTYVFIDALLKFSGNCLSLE